MGENIEFPPVVWGPFCGVAVLRYLRPLTPEKEHVWCFTCSNVIFIADQGVQGSSNVLCVPAVVLYQHMVGRVAGIRCLAGYQWQHHPQHQHKNNTYRVKIPIYRGHSLIQIFLFSLMWVLLHSTGQDNGELEIRIWCHICFDLPRVDVLAFLRSKMLLSRGSRGSTGIYSYRCPHFIRKRNTKWIFFNYPNFELSRQISITDRRWVWLVGIRIKHVWIKWDPPAQRRSSQNFVVLSGKFEQKGNGDFKESCGQTSLSPKAQAWIEIVCMFFLCCIFLREFTQDAEHLTKEGCKTWNLVLPIHNALKEDWRICEQIHNQMWFRVWCELGWQA